MEIKCKVSFALPEELINALNITEDTAIYASFSEGRVVLEIADEDEYDEDECDEEDFDEDDYTEDDLYDEDDDYDCDEDDCDHCEYFCQHCGKCVLN
ncbi:MAG: hypothetical protein IKB28_07065 [Clostridia bacterium]|nr:hypothetical protein [Clostridia bacterium]